MPVGKTEKRQTQIQWNVEKGHGLESVHPSNIPAKIHIVKHKNKTFTAGNDASLQHQLYPSSSKII